MSRFLVSPAAQADLEKIWDYTAERWSAAQAEAYIRDIEAACHGLATGRITGRDSGDIRAGYHRQRVGAHMLFFKKRDDGVIDVIRILHAQMDFDAHL